MDLNTQCPRCGTVFAASLDQLQLRKGYIRCTHCAYIFDGFESAVAGDAPATEAPPAAPAAPFTSGTRPSVVRQRSATDPRGTAPAAYVPVEPEGARPPATPAFTISSVRSAPRNTRTEPVVEMPEPTGAEQDSRPESCYIDGAASPPESAAIYVDPIAGGERTSPRLPEFLDSRYERRTGFARVFWGALSVIGLALLAAQLVYVYRAQIAAQAPVFRPILTEACVPLKCDVPYPRHILRIAIMNSSLRTVTNSANANPDVSQMMLQVTLRNTYDKPQEWPTLTLDLMNFSGVLVAKKNIPPKDYLTPKALQGPFAAGSEITVAVPVSVTGFKINGFQLGKFFP
jgi:predicted Zn finger-like uncharacterized protein